MAQSPRECSNTLNNALRGGFGQTALSLMFRHHKTTIRGKQLLITSSPSSPPSWSPSRSSCSSPSGRSSSDLRLEKKFRHKTLAHSQKIRHPIDRKKGGKPTPKKKKKRRKGKETNKGERTKQKKKKKKRKKKEEREKKQGRKNSNNAYLYLGRRLRRGRLFSLSSDSSLGSSPFSSDWSPDSLSRGGGRGRRRLAQGGGPP